MGRTAAKRAHLAELIRERPEYGEILGLFREIYAYVDGREGETGLLLDPPAGGGADRIAAGFPLLSPESLRVEAGRTAAFLRGLIGVLRQAGREGQEPLARIAEALDRGSLPLETLFRACLARDRKPLDEAAQGASIPSPLLEFLFTIPLKVALEGFSLLVEPSLVQGWKQGVCPVCGGRAGMGEIAGEEGNRFLHCSGCSYRWPFPRIGCPYCDNRDPESLDYFEAGEEPTRVDVCRKCARYLKTRDSRRGHADLPLEIEDLATLHLELLAAKEGFERGK